MKSTLKKKAEEKLTAMGRAQGFYDKGEYTEALRVGRKAADKGDVEACYKVGCWCAKGIKGHIEQNTEDAVRYLTVAAEANHRDAQYKLGELLEGSPEASLSSQSFGWYKKAAEQGHSEAQKRMAYLCRHGINTPRDLRASYGWYERAATQGDASAQFIVGHMWQTGQSVGRNDITAHYWLEKAAAQGHKDALEALGHAYFEGQGTEKNYTIALACYQKVTPDEEQYSGRMRAYLGYLYEYGEGGITRNEEKARVCYKAALFRHSSFAHYRLGVMCEEGRGGTQDYAAARTHYKKAMEGLDRNYRHRPAAKKRLEALDERMAPITFKKQLQEERAEEGTVFTEEERALLPGSLSQEATQKLWDKASKAAAQPQGNKTPTPHAELLQLRKEMHQLKEQLQSVTQNQEPLLQQYHTEQLYHMQKMYCKHHPLLGPYYTTLEKKLTSFFLAFSVLESDLVVFDTGMVGQFCSSLEILTGCINFFGASASAIGSILGMAIEGLYEAHQREKYRKVNEWIGTLDRIQEIAEHTAFEMTLRYEEQLQALKSDKEAIKAAEYGIVRILRYIYGAQSTTRQFAQLQTSDEIARQFVRAASQCKVEWDKKILDWFEQTVGKKTGIYFASLALMKGGY